ncbi:hypothetical protein OMCYN_01884 [cyanobiont of Ornithocercus magnificus]|nr:hypothetical protein OMCYN_01884 [cyanobiont of Ornithocercus magnificus]
MVSTLVSLSAVLWSYFAVMAVCKRFSTLVSKESARVSHREKLIPDSKWELGSQKLSNRSLVYAYWDSEGAKSTPGLLSIFGVVNAILVAGTSIFFTYAIGYYIYMTVLI